jgi:uncharacterized membrane protein YqhA
MISSMGIYDLFLSRLDPAYSKDARPQWISFKSLDDFKSALGKLIVLVLIIGFFELTITNSPKFKESYEFLIPAKIVMTSFSIKNDALTTLTFNMWFLKRLADLLECDSF